jgi:hypothetical protein
MLMHGRSAEPATNIPGRSKPATSRLSGKHPMAAAGTVRMGDQIRNTGMDNKARNRVVSIASAWLANYLAEEDAGGRWTYYVVSQKTSKEWTKGTPKPGKADPTLLSDIGRALNSRLTDCNRMLTGTKRIRYTDQDGRPI